MTRASKSLLLLTFWELIIWLTTEAAAYLLSLLGFRRSTHDICPISDRVHPPTCTISWQPVTRCNGRKAG